MKSVRAMQMVTVEQCARYREESLAIERERDWLLVALKNVTGSVIKSTTDRDGSWRAVRTGAMDEAETLIAEIEASK
jgi:hypothetical protein